MEDIITRIDNKLNEIRLSDISSALAGAIKDLLNSNPEIKNQEVSLKDAKEQIKNVILDTSLNISRQTRQKNITILNRINSYPKLLKWLYDLMLKADDLGVIKPGDK